MMENEGERVLSGGVGGVFSGRKLKKDDNEEVSSLLLANDLFGAVNFIYFPFYFRLSIQSVTEESIDFFMIKYSHTKVLGRTTRKILMESYKFLENMNINNNNKQTITHTDTHAYN